MYTLTISELRPSSCPQTAWSLEVICEANKEGADPNIFVYHAKPDGDTYSNVASLQDMNSLTQEPHEIVNEEGNTQYIPYYRTNKVTLDFYNASEAARFKRLVEYDTRLLVKEYEDSRSLQTVEVINI